MATSSIDSTLSSSQSTEQSNEMVDSANTSSHTLAQDESLVNTIKSSDLNVTTDVPNNTDSCSGDEQSQKTTEALELSITKSTTVRTYQRRSRATIVPTDILPKIDVAVNVTATAAISEPSGVVRTVGRRGRPPKKNINTTKIATETDANDSICSTSFSDNSVMETSVDGDATLPVDTQTNVSKVEANSCDSSKTHYWNQTVSNTVTNCAGISDTNMSTNETIAAEQMIVDDIRPQTANGKQSITMQFY